MIPFVPEDSIVRKIWGKSDTILFIFAGSAAEFALNKAVDWLYFTGKLPADPIGRLFSTVTYARWIIFSGEEEALKAIDKIASIHSAVEEARGAAIPDWAYRDVLYMLIHYSIAAYELLEHKLSQMQKENVYDVFYRVGVRMGLKELRSTHAEWLEERKWHMQKDLAYSGFTADLFIQYKKHLGANRFKILKEAQLLVIPPEVRRLLNWRKISLLRPAVPAYKLSRIVKLDNAIRTLLLPSAYREQIMALNVNP